MGSISVCQGEQHFSPTGTDTGQRNAGAASLLHGQVRLASALPLPSYFNGAGGCQGCINPNSYPINGGKASRKRRSLHPQPRAPPSHRPGLLAKKCLLFQQLASDTGEKSHMKEKQKRIIKVINNKNSSSRCPWQRCLKSGYF